MPLTLSSETLARIASKLPADRPAENLRIITAYGSIQATTDGLTPTEQALIAAETARLDTAGGPPMLTNGAPTIMRIVAWLGHEGKNDNDLAFVADELGPAADRIREPNFLLMDFNHSAVLPFSFDQKAIGVWYRAEKRWDPKAKNGQGAYGILAFGIMWAWAFPDYANNMLADQEREGVLKFSMACLPETVEFARDQDGPFEIAHNPVFLTLSALDVTPADKDALGLGKEGSDDPQLEQQLTTKLIAASHDEPEARTPLPALAAQALTEDQMDELQKEINTLKEQLAAAVSRIDALTAAETEVKTLTAEVESLKSQLTEVETTKDALVAEAQQLRESADQLNTELTAAREQLDAVAAKEAAEAKTARYATRLAELPESYVAALEKRTADEQAAFERKWTDASDEDFADFKKEIEFAFSNLRVSYVDISRREGRLPVGGGSQDDISDMLSSIKR